MSDRGGTMPFLLTPGLGDNATTCLSQIDKTSAEDLCEVLTSMEEVVLLYINGKVQLNCKGILQIKTNNYYFLSTRKHVNFYLKWKKHIQTFKDKVLSCNFQFFFYILASLPNSMYPNRNMPYRKLNYMKKTPLILPLN